MTSTNGEKYKIELTVNDTPIETEVDVEETLLHLLREKFKLLGVKEGCQRGECGACTVLIDGSPAYSCQTLAVQVHNKKIVTIEGLHSDDGSLHPIQQLFLEKSAVRCGFCLPGIILSTAAFLEKFPDPTPQQIKQLLSSHLCSCGIYQLWLEVISDYVKLQKNKRLNP